MTASHRLCTGVGLCGDGGDGQGNSCPRAFKACGAGYGAPPQTMAPCISSAKCQENSLVSIGRREIWFSFLLIQMAKHPQRPHLRTPNGCLRKESGREAADCLLNPVGTVLLTSQRDLG